MLHMPGLARLHAAMKAVSLTRARFRLRHNDVEFECVFLTDLVPFEFALASLGHSIFLVFDVHRGYRVVPFLGDAYGPLLNALATGAETGRKLVPAEFLQQIDAKLPARVNARDYPSSADVVRVYRHIEEAEKVHFVRLIPHTPASGRHVSGDNLAKTRRLLGENAHEWCQRNNVSTGWSDVAPANPVASPWLR